METTTDRLKLSKRAERKVSPCKEILSLHVVLIVKWR